MKRRLLFDIRLQLRRWRLRTDLRMLSHEWSPMPTSSTAPQLTRAYLGESDYQGLDIEASAQTESISNTTQEDGLKPCMRWTMIRREGSVWTSWRPGKLDSANKPRSVDLACNRMTAY